MKQLKETVTKNSDSKIPWGLISKYIRGRCGPCGCKCENFFKTLVKEGKVKDPVLLFTTIDNYYDGECGSPRKRKALNAKAAAFVDDKDVSSLILICK